MPGKDTKNRREDIAGPFYYAAPKETRANAVRPQDVVYRFWRWKPLVNARLPARLKLRDPLQGVLMALAIKARAAYPNGVPPAATEAYVATSRPELKRIARLECHEKTVYNHLVRLEAAGVIRFAVSRNSADGTRTVRNPHTAFGLWIPAWVLCGQPGGECVPQAFLDELDKKQKPPDSLNFEGFGKNLPLLSLTLEPNIINTAVDMLAGCIPEPKGRVTPPAHPEPAEPGTRNLEPKADRGQKKPAGGEPQAQASRTPGQTGEPKEPGSKLRANQVLGSPPRNQGRGAGQRLREKLYGKRDGTSKDLADKHLQEQLQIMLLDFWATAKASLYPGQRFSQAQESQALALIWDSVYNSGVSRNNWSLARWKRFQDQIYERLDIVARYLRRDPDRFVVQPAAYFDQHNTKSGFAATYGWWVKQQAHHAQALADRTLMQAMRSVREGRPPKGNPPMGLMQLCQYWRHKIAGHRVQHAIDAFDRFIISHKIH